MALTPSGALWIGGDFPTFNGFTQPALARLHGDDQTGPGRIEFVESFTKVKENAGVVTLKLRRYWGTDGPATVHYETADGTGTAGVHYTAASGTASLASGEIEKSITVTLLDDSTPHFNRWFTVTLSQPRGGVSLGEFHRVGLHHREHRGILAPHGSTASGWPQGDYNKCSKTPAPSALTLLSGIRQMEILLQLLRTMGQPTRAKTYANREHELAVPTTRKQTLRLRF